jgi:hypothetical protein
MLIGSLGSWLFSGLKNEIKILRDEKSMLMDKVQTLEIIVARDYALRDDLEKLAKEYKEDLHKLMTAMFAKLDRIENKLDNKVDKK